MALADTWNSNDANVWQQALDEYDRFVGPDNVAVEKELALITPAAIAELSSDEWFSFLKDKYYQWKYTAQNRYATTTRRLEQWNDSRQKEKLLIIRDLLLSEVKRDPEDHEWILSIASLIPGLGVAGASGLLSLLWPEYFGTVDQFVVKALRTLPQYEEVDWLQGIKDPGSLTPKQAGLLMAEMKSISDNLNKKFDTDYWTPRKVDMILWASRE